MSATTRRVIVSAGVWVAVGLLAVLALPDVARFVSHPPQWIRVLNVLLTVATATVIGVRLNDVWGDLETSDRVIRLGFFGFVTAACYGSAVSYQLRLPTTTSALFFTVACVLVLGGVALSWRQHRRRR